MIVLTVAIPMFNADKIGWLALESLTRQENIDFEWELVIAEEQDKNMFGYDRIVEYKERLKQVGCQRLHYIPLKNWIPLPIKWRMMAEDNVVSESSKVFTFAGADNYNYKDRLKIEYDLVNSGLDWVSSLIMPFFFIRTGEIFVADYKRFEPRWKTHAGMAFSTKTEYVKHLPDSDKRYGIDGWLFDMIREYVLKSKKDFSIKRVEGDYWKHGFGTHGLNLISGSDRYDILKRTCDINNSLKDGWPLNVMVRLGALKSYAKI